MYTLVLTLHPALLLGFFATSWLDAAAGDPSQCPLLFFTNTSSYNVVVGQRVDATTYPDRAKVSAIEPFVWQVAQAGACIPLGRVNKDQYMIDLIYKFYGAYYGSITGCPILFEITRKKNEPPKRLYNVVLCQSGWVGLRSYTSELRYGVSPAVCMQHIFTRADRCLPFGISGKLECMDDLKKIESAFIEAAKNPDYAYLFLHLPKIDMQNRASTAAMLSVVKHLWCEVLESGVWVASPDKGKDSASKDKDLALQQGRSLSYYDWLGMHANAIFGQAYATVEAQCK